MSVSRPDPLRVLIGVNGIGMGHSVRQGELARYLRRRGHDVQVLTSGASVGYFRDLGFAVLEGWLPNVPGTGTRIAMRATLAANKRTVRDGINRHREIRAEIRAAGVPDVFVSDYEPNVTPLAYRFGRPLISIDQQSKYRRLDLPPLGAYKASEERMRLRLFMPRVRHSFVCSFVPLASPNDSVEIVAPILADEVRAADISVEPVVVAYFSRYFAHRPDLCASALSEVFGSALRDRQLRIYVQPDDVARLGSYAGGNVEVCAFDRPAFLDDLRRCEAVFANAGFNLISEALKLEKPCYLVPLPTYDQHWCAWTVNRHGLGIGATSIDRAQVTSFLDRREEFAARVASHTSDHLTCDPRARIARYLETLVTTPPGRRAEGQRRPRRRG